MNGISSQPRSLKPSTVSCQFMLITLKGQPFSLIGIMKRSRELHQGYLGMEFFFEKKGGVRV
jgi:hypothetical protein